MIVTSFLDDSKYFWVKIPRTATYAYEKLFFPKPDNVVIIHTHNPYFLLKTANCDYKPMVKGGFSVVRHPLPRFISALKYLRLKHNSIADLDDTEYILSICEFCGKETMMEKEKFLNSHATQFIDFLKDETTFYDFIYSHVDKNCILKSDYTWDTILQTQNPGLVSSMFKPQTMFAYHPHVKIFKYENLMEFNTWIETTLGYSTKNVGVVNSSKDVSINIDVTTKKFKDLVKYLFHDDFKLFGYDI